LFFREQAKRLTIGIVSGEASRPSTAQETDRNGRGRATLKSTGDGTG
jgi:hypothetical protein